MPDTIPIPVPVAAPVTEESAANDFLTARKAFAVATKTVNDLLAALDKGQVVLTKATADLAKADAALHQATK
jgi:hypothetical protein